MKKALSVLVSVFLISTIAKAQSPQGINYQGIARTASGGAIASATISLRLSILNSSSTVVYEETQSATTNGYGLYVVTIGAGAPVIGTFTGINWSAGSLSIKVEMDPSGGTSYTVLGTNELQSVPYALFANNTTLAGDVTGPGNANTISKLQGKPVSASAPVTGDVLEWNGTNWVPSSGFASVTAGTANYIPVFASATTIRSSSIYQNGTLIGMGTTTPAAGLQVVSSTDSMITYMATSSAAKPVAHGTAEIDYAGIADTVTGLKANAYNVATNHGTIGAEGLGTGDGLLGVGLSSYTSGGTTTQRGVEGDAYGNDLPMGIAGFSNLYSTAPAISIGVYGSAAGGTTNYAGYFAGDIYVGGTVYATTKSFKIDDPIDPANKYLVHTCVESNEMTNVYSGNITTGVDGKAVVNLPAYFEALNTDPRYQLTVIGTFAQAIVSKKISGNSFEITTSSPNVEVSWQVTGVRHDAAAMAHPSPTEVDKESFNKGRYLDAAAYGQPASSQAGNELNHPHASRNEPTSVQSVPAGK